MFRLGIRSYLKNLPHFFTVLGVVALFVILSFCIFIPVMVESTQNLVNNITTSFTEAGMLNINNIVNKFIDLVRNLNWDEPLECFTNILNPNWLLKALQSCVDPSELEKFNQITNTLLNSFSIFTKSMIGSIMLMIIFFLLGIGASIIVTKIAIDLHMKSNQNPFRYIVSFIIDVVMFVGIWYLFLYCLTYTTIAFYLLLIGVFLLILFLYPIQNTIVYGRGKVRLKDVMTFRNLLGLALSTLIGYALSYLIVFLCYTYFSHVFGLIIAVPLFILTYLVCENASKNYVCEKYFELTTEEKIINKHLKQNNNNKKIENHLDDNEKIERKSKRKTK